MKKKNIGLKVVNIVLGLLALRLFTIVFFGFLLPFILIIASFFGSANTYEYKGNDYIVFDKVYSGGATSSEFIHDISYSKSSKSIFKTDVTTLALRGDKIEIEWESDTIFKIYEIIIGEGYKWKTLVGSYNIQEKKYTEYAEKERETYMLKYEY